MSQGSKNILLSSLTVCFILFSHIQAYASTLNEIIELDEVLDSNDLLKLNTDGFGQEGLNQGSDLLFEQEDIFKSANYKKELLQSKISKFPNNTNLRKQLAFLYVQDKNFQEAINQLELILEYDPENVPVALDIAHLSGAIGGPTAVKAALNKMRTTYSDPFPFEIALVQLNNDIGLRSTARKDLQEMLLRDFDLDRKQKLQLLLSRFYLEEGHAVEAQNLIDDILKVSPENVNALLFRAAFNLKNLDYKKALEDISFGLSFQPGNITLLRLAAQTEARLGNFDTAMQYLALVVEKSNYEPDYVLLYANALQDQGRIDDAIKLLKQATGLRRGSAKLVAAFGVLHVGLSDWDEAEKTAVALRRFGTDAAVRDSEKIRVAILQGRGKNTEAIQILQQLGAGGSDVGSAANLVAAYIENGQMDEATKYVDNWIAKSSENPAALLMRGSIHEMNGEEVEAKALFDKVVHILPQSPMAHTTLARHHLRYDNVELAEETLRAGLRSLPGRPQLQMPLVEILVRKKDYLSAVELMEKIVAVYPDNALVANNYASLIADHFPDNTEKLRRAIAVAQQLKNSKIPQFRDTYGWLLHIKGDNESALATLKTVIAAIPDDGWANFHIGMIFAAMSEVEEAQQHLQRALASTDTNFSKSIKALEVLRDLGDI